MTEYTIYWKMTGEAAPALYWRIGDAQGEKPATLGHFDAGAESLCSRTLDEAVEKMLSSLKGSMQPEDSLVFKMGTAPWEGTMQTESRKQFEMIQAYLGLKDDQSCADYLREKIESAANQ